MNTPAAKAKQMKPETETQIILDGAIRLTTSMSPCEILRYLARSFDVFCRHDDEMSRATLRNPDSELRRNPSENARDVEWIEIESSHQQGSSLGVGEARLLQAALGVPRHRQVSLTQTRAPRAMHVCSARTQPLAGNRHATLQNPEAASCAGTQPLAVNRRVRRFNRHNVFTECTAASGAVYRNDLREVVAWACSAEVALCYPSAVSTECAAAPGALCFNDLCEVAAWACSVRRT